MTGLPVCWGVITAHKTLPLSERVGPFRTQADADEWAARYETETGDEWIATVHMFTTDGGVTP